MKEKNRPNILFILADDLGWGDVSYHGSINRTPNIDRLASRGIELDQHYVAPLCTPTRVSLLTGRYPGRFGTHATSPSNPPVLPDGYDTLAASLKEAGYETALFGKWHLGSDPQFCPNEYGFDTSYGSLAGGVDPYNHRYKRGQYSRTWHRDGELIEEEGHVTDLITREAVEWIESREEPWFCYVPYTAVHIPVDAPEGWLDEYEHETYSKDEGKDRAWKRYAAYASHMDQGVGQLIETLKRTCQLDETIVVFCGDNGAAGTGFYGGTGGEKYPGWSWETPGLGNNSPLRGEKGQFYEGGVRTPSIVSWPGTLRPRRIDYPLNIIDWAPTLLRLAQSEREDPRWDGLDLWPLLAGERAELGERSFFWNLRDEKFAARRGDWKLIADEGLSPENPELFNLRSDPYEQIDLSKKRPEIVKELLEEIDHEHQKDGDTVRDDVDQWSKWG